MNRRAIATRCPGALLAIVVLSAGRVQAEAPPITALVGATAVDVSSFGKSTHDIPDSVVLFQGAKILAVGTRAQVAVPADATVVDVAGKFIVPGLIDGFSGMQSQAEANAELYEGVTSVVASGDDRRGTLFLAADPSPHIYVLDSAGSTDDWSLLRGDPKWRDLLADGTAPHELTPAQTKAQLIEIARRGTRAIWLGHNVTPKNTALILAQAHKLHLATYGELIATPYSVGIAAGVSCLLHMSRFELGLAPDELVTSPEVAADPDGNASKPAYDAAEKTDPTDPGVARYAGLIAAHQVALMPTFSLFYAVLPEHRNLWKEPGAALFDAKQMFRTTDPATGELAYPNPKVREKLEAAAQRLFALDKALIAQHVRVLAASGSTWQGTMAGISMHTELELLVRAGLTPREAIAAATGNYAGQFGWSDLGQLAPGRSADLLVVSKDPTLDVRSLEGIEAIYLAGKPVDRAALLKPGH